MDDDRRKKEEDIRRALELIWRFRLFLDEEPLYAYMAAGEPFGPEPQALELWIEFQTLTTVN